MPTATARPAPAADGASPLALPGIVDRRGDARERRILPRRAVAFPPDPAIAETDRRFAANGIAAGFHAVIAAGFHAVIAAWKDGPHGHAMARDSGLRATVERAALSRPRPVASAAATTVPGVVPLPRDVFQIGRAVAVLAGLTVGTFIAMVVVATWHAIFHGPKPATSESAPLAQTAAHGET